MKNSRLLTILLLILSLGAPHIAHAAQEPPVRATITVDPLGFAFLGPSTRVELGVGKRTGLVAGARDMEHGWAAQYMAGRDGHRIRSGMLFSAGTRFYRPGERLCGWYLGPVVEFGNIDTDTHDAHALLLQADMGYTFITRSRLACGLGAQTGIGSGWNRGTVIGSPAGETRYYPVGNILFVIGYAL